MQTTILAGAGDIQFNLFTRADSMMSDELQQFVQDLQRAAEENRALFLGSIQMLSGAVDEKDPYTRGHSDRVTRYSLLIAREMKLDDNFLETLRISAQLHVDGTGEFLALDRIDGADDYWLRIQIPQQLARYVIHKGSLSIEGISLTVAAIEGTAVTVAIIPHTAEMTNLLSLKRGDPVNLEVDMIAKYVEKMMKGESGNSPLTLEQLVQQGF